MLTIIRPITHAQNNYDATIAWRNNYKAYKSSEEMVRNFYILM